MASWKDLLVQPSTPILDAIRILDETASQIVLVVDDQGRLVGTVTDGDIRRAILRSVPLGDPVIAAANRDPRVARIDDAPEAIADAMAGFHVRHVPLVDDQGHVVGLASKEDVGLDRGVHHNWVVLLAGGLGTRLRPLTENMPKPLLEVGGKPLLEIILNNFVRQGFSKFYVSVNYKAKMVQNHFGDGRRWNVEIRYLHEERPLGTAGPLGLIEERHDAPLLVMNGDLLTNVNFQHLLSYHQQMGSAATMCVREFNMEVPFGVVSVESDRIKRIVEKPVQNFLINAGIYMFEPATLASVQRDEPLDIPELFDRIIRTGHSTAVFPIREYWLDIGQPADYRLANSVAADLFR